MLFLRAAFITEGLFQGNQTNPKLDIQESSNIADLKIQEFGLLRLYNE